ncbi:MAG: FAD-dependent monooxygenase [Phycisphaerales bacterium]|nr:FAD-dependent monooxygenase [Phycisphaerales bacterium]
MASSPARPPRSVLILGAGLAGSLLGCALARAGWSVQIVERRPDPRRKGYAGGRSINLALSVRGIEALRAIGMHEPVLAGAIPMRGRMMHSRAGELAFQPYSKNPTDAINSVSRAGLNLTLIENADRCGVQLTFDQRCIDIDLDTMEAIFQSEPPPGASSSAPLTRIAASVIIGADGAFSAVRTRLQKLDRFDYAQSYLAHGYKELHIPPSVAPDGSPTFALDKNALHIWPRGGSMMIALPNTDRSFTCTLFWPFEGDHSFANLRTEEGVLSFFKQEYPDAVPLMPTLGRDFLANPASSLVTIRCRPWSFSSPRGHALLLGDAAHAIVPFFGQGMNAAFEDCRVLVDLLAAHDQDFAAVIPRFEAMRKPNADAIADMALENFIEMRDKVGSAAFLYKKRVEQTVHHLFPDRVHPLYNLVSFSTVPYAEAQRRGRELNAALDRIIAKLPLERAAAMPDDQWRAEIARLAAPELPGS